MTHLCRLCGNEMVFFTNTRNKNYYRCHQCDSIQLEESQILNPIKEKIRYDSHNNDVLDLGYQKFVSPITNYVLTHFKKDAEGLDFGAGPGPVISKLLSEKGYSIIQYDPHYHPNHEVLDHQYDYIIACEVIEHFNHPKKEFKQLKKSIKPNGQWIFMTDLYDNQIQFDQWYYKNDETHIIFYTRKTLEFIKITYNFKNLSINQRLIIFSN